MRYVIASILFSFLDLAFETIEREMFLSAVDRGTNRFISTTI